MGRLLILGGSDAGISAGLRAKQLDPSSPVTIVLAVKIDPVAKAVDLVDRRGQRQTVRYDRLVIATGAEPVNPPIAGLNDDGVLVLHTMEDSFRVREQVVDRGARRAVIIGGGYIGLEMADALRHRGLQVTLVEQADAVMTSVDVNLGQLLGEELKRHGVELVTGVAVERIDRVRETLRVSGSADFERQADMVLVVVGVSPNTMLARDAGITTGIKGAVRVNRRMETNLPDIFAAGDCVETWHRVLERPTYLPLGTTAHKQGRVAGENAAGGNREFQGSLGTQVVKLLSWRSLGPVFAIARPVQMAVFVRSQWRRVVGTIKPITRVRISSPSE